MGYERQESWGSMTLRCVEVIHSILPSFHLLVLFSMNSILMIILPGLSLMRVPLIVSCTNASTQSSPSTQAQAQQADDAEKQARGAPDDARSNYVAVKQVPADK